MAKYDCGGYATRNDLRCSDGRVIRRNAFKVNDGMTVPVVWQHQRNEPTNVLGHSLLENRDDGVYAYIKFNDSKNGRHAKLLVEHGDINALSIYANQLKQNGTDVMHGMIREVSLVVAGANPGAFIDTLGLEHDDDSFSEAVIYTPDDDVLELDIEHADEDTKPSNNEEDDEDDDEQISPREVYNSMNEQQKALLHAMVGYARSKAGDSDEEDEEEAEQSDEYDEEDESMVHNVFEKQGETKPTALSHSDVEAIFQNARRVGSLKMAVNDYLTEHAQELGLEHSITDGGHEPKFPEDVLFPEARAVTPTPEMIARDQQWVSLVWNATRKSPFSRIKSWAADITADAARAKGYVKGKKKLEEVITMLRRITTPQTVYKLQKMDRDDIIDITGFDIIAWIKAEMRLMLNEELSRAILIGDGRDGSPEDKILPDHIRPVWTDDDLYTIHYPIVYAGEETDDEKADMFITAVNKAMVDYNGSGSPVCYMEPAMLSNLLLAKDKIGRRLYNTKQELANALRVRDIVEVPVFKGAVRKARSGVEAETGKKYTLQALIVNLTDYTVGADRGGAVSMFDDFDLDYNKFTYLIETRCSGALTKPYSAIAIELQETDQD